MNDAAAHKKQRESLSPEQKVKVMTINAAALKKQYELLPPEKKARLMETKTEQRHEHLSEEEKKTAAQIRSVAATLYERVDLDKPTVEFLREHFFVSCLDMYRTKVLLYHMMVLMARMTKVRC